MSQRILIVSGDNAGVSATLRVLISAGYEARSARTFEDASRLLATEAPDLLITDERLGAFNGLHLVVRGHATHPHMSAIVTTPTKDTVLECEARRLDAECVVKPLDPRGWLRPISRTLERPALAS
jgi:two-component system response regulator AtoC